MRHHAIVVTGWDKTKVATARAKAKEIGNIVSDIVDTELNGYYSFLVATDGSKEGWAESNRGDDNRRRFIGWLLEKEQEELYMDWAEIQYGDDGNISLMLRHSDEEKGE